MRLVWTHLIRVASVLCILAGTASAQVLFRADFNDALFPLYGFNSAMDVTERWQRRPLAGQGPDGTDAAELQQLYVASLQNAGSFYGGEFGWGWDVGNLPPVAQGGTRFWRFRIRWSRDTNWRGKSSSNGEPLPYMHTKLLIASNGCGTDCRVIIETEPRHSPTDGTIKFYLALDGGQGQVQTPYFPAYQWLNVQIEADSSSTDSTADGRLKIWINNNNYASPTAVTSNMVIDSNGWDHVRLGAYNNQAIQPDGVNKIQYSAFEIASAFDSTWHRQTSSSTPVAPAAPTGLHIVR